MRSLLDAGETQPELCFVGYVAGRPVARAGFLIEVPPPPAPTETYLFGLAVEWADPPARAAALALLEHALPIGARHGAPVDARVNAELHRDAAERRRLFEEAGFNLFQEKAGHVWLAGESPATQLASEGPAAQLASEGSAAQPAARLRFRSLLEVDRAAFLDVLARGPVDTLDRNDRYYFQQTGPLGWANVMTGYLGPGDEATWKIGYDTGGLAVGYVMLSAFDEPGVGTISHIGVVPDQRGRGYIDDFLAEVNADAVRRGFSSILSDVDVLNWPMRQALERAGHRSGVRPWHVWHYRWSPGDD